jgi:predicted outer membrane repeat protein
MIERTPALRVGVVVVSLAIGAFLFGTQARAAQPECKAINKSEDVSFNSNGYADPLGTAIARAVPGDALKVIGTCVGNFVIDKDLGLEGRPSQKQADTLDGDRTGTVLTIGGGVTVAISNLTITHTDLDATTLAGGIQNSGVLTLSNSTVRENFTLGGGGIHNSGTLTLVNSVVSGNDAAFEGGGISNSGTVVLEDSTVSGNGAQAGGGISNSGTLTLIASTVSGNSAGFGGGIYNFATATLIRSTVSGNSAGFGGGGIRSSGMLSLTDSKVTENTVSPPGQGGGILSSGTLTLHGTNNLCGNTPDDWPGCLP